MVYDEITVISENTDVTGDITSGGSLEIRGILTGAVSCNGKLTVAGVLKGDSKSAEFFADGAKLDGEINCEGAVKIGVGSIIIGSITATSAVIAGAVKGDIDVKGPVIVDASAVIVGNIKSSSVQINNGAIVEGFCSQCYSDVDVQSFFEQEKGNE